MSQQNHQEAPAPSRREVLAGLGAAIAVAGLGSAFPALAEDADGTGETDGAAANPDPSASSDSSDASAPSTVVWTDPAVVGNWPEGASAGDDFVVYATREWHEQNELPEGYSRWTGFTELALEVKRDVIGLLGSEAETQLEKTASGIFHAALDWEKRDASGLSAVSDLVGALLAAGSTSDVANLFLDGPRLLNLTPLINAAVTSDAHDSSTGLAYISVASLSLSDSAEYTQRTETGNRRYEARQAFALAMLSLAGVEDDAARQMVADFFDFEGKLARFIYPTAESYKEDWVQRNYNVYTRDELAALSPRMPLVEILDAGGLDGAERYCVNEPAFVEGLSGLFDDENLEGLRAYLTVNLLCGVAPYADSASEDAYIEYTNAVQGSTGRLPDEERAYNCTNDIADELVGVVYGRHFFDDESRTDVEGMLDTILDTFRSRLEAAEWMGEGTRELALRKVETMTKRIGYPVDTYRFAWDELDLEPELADGASLLDLYVSITDWEVAQLYATAGKPVDRGVWPMSGALVNACYNPLDNSITFPAAILRNPFYDKGRSAEANYGGVGAVIGHEITHAFDTTGSQFDAEGNLNNWWTEEDRAAFSERTARVRDRYASIEVWGGEHADGDLTLGETVADLGGVACCLQILDGMDDPDYEAFFLAYANNWREIITPELRLYYLKVDPHAPNYLRADITSQQFQQFYDTFGVQEGDFMYVPEDERLTVW